MWWYFIFLSISYREITMSNQDDHSNKNDQHQSSTDSDDPVENVVGNFKTLLISIAGVVLVLSILVLLPMLLTYLSEGDYRPVGEPHPGLSSQSDYK
jgi:uncharacterized protein YqhQ